MARRFDFTLILEINGEKHRVYPRGLRFVAEDCEYGFVPEYDATRACETDETSIRLRRLMKYEDHYDLTGRFVAYESDVIIHGK